jgi:anti-anti-sigma factor
MEITTRKERQFQLADVKGRVDAVSAPDFEKHLSDLISQGERMFIINLSHLEYISSAGLRSILALAKKLKAENGDLLFTGLQGPVEEVFKISGFYSIFKIFNSPEDILQQV